MRDIGKHPGVRALALLALIAAVLLTACADDNRRPSDTPPAEAPAPTESGSPTPAPPPWTVEEVIADTVDVLQRRDSRAVYNEVDITVEELTEGEAAARLPEGTENVFVVDAARPVLFVTLHGEFAAIATLDPLADLVAGTWYRIVPLDRSLQSNFFTPDSDTTP